MTHRPRFPIISFVLDLLFPRRIVRRLRSEAVEHGFAAWVPNPETGRSTFTWKHTKGK